MAGTRWHTTITAEDDPTDSVDAGELIQPGSRSNSNTLCAVAFLDAGDDALVELQTMIPGDGGLGEQGGRWVKLHSFALREANTGDTFITSYSTSQWFRFVATKLTGTNPSIHVQLAG